MTYLWRSEDMIEAMQGRPIGDMPEGITAISIDSRNLDEGAAFFAIKGDRFDGHDFVSSAYANGAGVLIVSEDKLAALGNLNAPMIVVRDVLDALIDLGRAARARSGGKIVAVTGSVGKTTTKEMLRTALSACGRVHASVASFNNHWGVPLTLARMPQDTEFGVFEIGMNHPDEIRPLVKMVQPHAAMITCVEAAHMGNFKDLYEIALAKSEIMEGLVEDGSILLNRDNSKFTYLEKCAQDLNLSGHIFSYGENDEADFKLLSSDLHSDHCVFKAQISGAEYEVTLGAPGRHMVQNALGVLGLCHLIDADINMVTKALAGFSAEKGRGAQHELAISGGKFLLFDESYNANPASMRAAINLLAATQPSHDGRRIAVLGDMLEMGAFSEDMHRDLSTPLQEANIDILGLAGPDMNYLAQSLETSQIDVFYQKETDDLVDWLIATVRAGDVVMVKSSLGIGFGKIISALQKSFRAVEPE